MKKIVTVLMALTVLVTLACPAFADFTPSVSYKGAPEVVTVKDTEGKEAIGVIRNNTGAVSYVYEGGLVATAVSEAKTSTSIPDEAESTLLSVYDQLTNGSMTLPYEKLGDVDADKMVIRDLFDVSLLQDDHREAIEPEGVVFDITFDLGVAQNVNVYAMTYKNNAWNPVVKTVNNGDGTVTCTFEHFCPVAFVVEESDTAVAPDTGDNSKVMLWVAVLAVSACALVGATVVYRRKAVK